ncbi:MAG: PAS domain-containing protein [Chitinophagaceae bacterium]
MTEKILTNTKEIKKTNLINGFPKKSFTETMANGFFTVDHKWTVQYWNKAAEKLLGVPAVDIIGKNLWGKLVGIIPVSFYSVYYKKIQPDKPVYFKEYWEEMDDWFDVIVYQSNDILSVSFKSFNQSPHIENPEKQLKAFNELYKFITEVTNDCLWEWDLQSSEIFWIDGGHKRTFGYPIENTLISQNFWESRLHPDDKLRLLTKLNKIISGEPGAIWEEEYRFKKANGEYAYVHDRGHIIYGLDNKASRMIGATQDITVKKLLENKLEQVRLSKQREITDAVLTAQEIERTAIGMELHDNVNQILAVTKLYLQLAKGNEKKREKYLEKSLDFIVTVIDEIRKISKALIFPDTHIIGLFDCINNLIVDLRIVNPIKIEFQEDGIIEEEINEKMQVTIFRIVQEQVNNILKHAEATQASINISKHENEIVLLISDNGKGFDTSLKREGVGITNIISRAELFNGKVEIKSKPLEGFQLRVVLPYIYPAEHS